MVTKHGFLITMVIGVAVGALILAYSAPTQGAGAGGKGSSSGASKTNINESSKVDINETSKIDSGETSKTKVYEKENVDRPVKAGVTSPKYELKRGVTSSKPPVSGDASSVKIPLDAKGKELGASAAIFGNQGVAV